MERPLLFLDIDGVLNSVQFYMRRSQLHAQAGHGIYAMDPDAVKRLEWICDETNCDIVIASTWRRIHSIADIAKYFKATGYSKDPPIIGATPVISYFTSIHKRGIEVSEYLTSLLPSSYRDRYVCIDDDADFFTYQNLVQVNNEYGLTDEDANAAIAILKSGS